MIKLNLVFFDINRKNFYNYIVNFNFVNNLPQKEYFFFYKFVWRNSNNLISFKSNYLIYTKIYKNYFFQNLINKDSYNLSFYQYSIFFLKNNKNLIFKTNYSFFFYFYNMKVLSYFFLLFKKKIIFNYFLINYFYINYSKYINFFNIFNLIFFFNFNYKNTFFYVKSLRYSSEISLINFNKFV